MHTGVNQLFPHAQLHMLGKYLRNLPTMRVFIGIGKMWNMCRYLYPYNIHILSSVQVRLGNAPYFGLGSRRPHCVYSNPRSRSRITSHSKLCRNLIGSQPWLEADGTKLFDFIDVLEARPQEDSVGRHTSEMFTPILYPPHLMISRHVIASQESHSDLQLSEDYPEKVVLTYELYSEHPTSTLRTVDMKIEKELVVDK